LCGPDSSEALCGGLFTDDKAELQFFLLSFSAVLPGRCHGKNGKMGGGGTLKPKKIWNAYYYTDKKKEFLKKGSVTWPLITPKQIKNESGMWCSKCSIFS
jgi:hypothetical protein